MNPKSLGIAGLMALLALALIAVIASNPFTSQASTHDSEVIQETPEQLDADIATAEITQPQQFDMLQGTDEESEDSDPYIGVLITELDDGSVKVVRVMANGPSEGILMQGDVIAEVDGTTIDGASDLVDAIAEAGSGATVTLTVTRDGSTLTVDVTVADRETSKSSLRTRGAGKFNSLPRFGFSWSGKGKSRALPDERGRVIHTQIVVENEDGSFSTHRAVIGTVSNVDTSAGTFTLTPKDGSDAIDYTISDTTRVVMDRTGNIGGLYTEDETLVVDSDSEVKMVKQGEQSGKRSHFFRGGKRFGSHDGGRRSGGNLLSDRKLLFDNLLPSRYGEVASTIECDFGSGARGLVVRLPGRSPLQASPSN